MSLCPPGCWWHRFSRDIIQALHLPALILGPPVLQLCLAYPTLRRRYHFRPSGQSRVDSAMHRGEAPFWACFCRLHRLTCWIQEDTGDSSSSGRQAGLWHPLKVKVPHLKFTKNPQCLQQLLPSGKWYKICHVWQLTFGHSKFQLRNLIIVLNN